MNMSAEDAGGVTLKPSETVLYSPAMKAIAGNEKEEGFGMLHGGPYITS